MARRKKGTKRARGRARKAYARVRGGYRKLKRRVQRHPLPLDAKLGIGITIVPPIASAGLAAMDSLMGNWAGSNDYSFIDKGFLAFASGVDDICVGYGFGKIYPNGVTMTNMATRAPQQVPTRTKAPSSGAWLTTTAVGMGVTIQALFRSWLVRKVTKAKSVKLGGMTVA